MAKWTNLKVLIERLKNALYCAMIITYAQGMAQLQVASKIYDYEMNLEQVAKYGAVDVLSLCEPGRFQNSIC
jgi:6-phosphogluconate dehydrogenase